MDFAKTGLSNDAAEVAVTPHKKYLSLEARHSKAIESARELRLNLSASIFIPKLPQKSTKNFTLISATKHPKSPLGKPLPKPGVGLTHSLKTAKNIKIANLQKTLQRVKRKLKSSRNLTKVASTKKGKPRIIEKYRKIFRKVNRNGIKTKMKTLTNNCARSQTAENDNISDDAIENALKSMGLEVSTMEDPEMVTISESAEDIFQSLSLELSTSFANAQERHLRQIAKETRETKMTTLVKTNTKETIVIEDCHEDQPTSLEETNAHETNIVKEYSGGHFNTREETGATPEHAESKATPVEETTTNETIGIEDCPDYQYNIIDDCEATRKEINATIVIADWPEDHYNITEEHGERNTKDTNERIVSEEGHEGPFNITEEHGDTTLGETNTNDTNETILIEDDHESQFNNSEEREDTPLEKTTINETIVMEDQILPLTPLKETNNTNAADNCQTSPTISASPHQFYTESSKHVYSYNASLHSVREFQDVMEKVQYYFSTTSVDEEIYGNLRCLQDSINDFSIFLQKTYMDMDIFEEEQRQIYSNIAVTCAIRQEAEISTEFVVRIDVPEMPEQILTFRATDIIQCTLENCEKSEQIRQKRAEKRQQEHCSTHTQEPVETNTTKVDCTMATGTDLLAPPSHVNTTGEGHVNNVQMQSSETSTRCPYVSTPAHQFETPIQISETYTTANVHRAHTNKTPQLSPAHRVQHARNTTYSERAYRSETSDATIEILNAQNLLDPGNIPNRTDFKEHASYGIDNLPTTLNALHSPVPRQNQQQQPTVLPNNTTAEDSQSPEQGNTGYNNNSQMPPQYNGHPAYRNEIPTIGVPTVNVQNAAAHQFHVRNQNNPESNGHPMYSSEIPNHRGLRAPSAYRSEATTNDQYSHVPAHQTQVPNSRGQAMHPAFRQEALCTSSNSQYSRIPAYQSHVSNHRGHRNEATSKTQYSPVSAHHAGPNRQAAYRSQTLQMNSKGSHSPVPAYQSQVLNHRRQNIHPSYRGDTQNLNNPQTHATLNTQRTESRTSEYVPLNVQQLPQVSEHAEPTNRADLSGQIPQKYVTSSKPSNSFATWIKTKLLSASRVSDAKKNPHQQSKSHTQVPQDFEKELQRFTRPTVIKRKSTLNSPCPTLPAPEINISNNCGPQSVTSNTPPASRMQSDKRRKVETGQQINSPTQSPQDSESNLLNGNAIVNARDQLLNSPSTSTTVKTTVDSNFRKPTRPPHNYPTNAVHIREPSSNSVPVTNNPHAFLTYPQSVDSQQNTILRSTSLHPPSYPAQTREQHFINSHPGAFTTNPLLTPPQSVDVLPLSLFRPATYNAYPTFDPSIGVPMTPPSDDPVRQDGIHLNPPMLAATFGVYNLDGRSHMYKEMLYPPPGPKTYWEGYQP